MASSADRIIAEIQGRSMVEQFQIALQGTGLDPLRFARIIANEVRRTPRLAECDSDSIIGAAMTCAELGFEPGPALGHAWIIPRQSKRAGGAYVANFQLGYKGLVSLLWDSDKVAWVNARVVCHGDTFRWSLGAPPRIEAFEPCEDPGPVTHIFAAIGTTTGGQQIEVWTADELEAHRAEYVHEDSKAWETSFDVMAEKTLLFQAARFAPVSRKARRALTLHDLGERGLEQPFDVSAPAVQGEEAQAEVAESFAESTAQAKKNGELRERLAAKARAGRKGTTSGQRSRRTRA